MIHHNATANSLDYAERYQEAQVREGVDERDAERRERHEPAYIKTPELDAVRDRMNALLREEASLGDWAGRLIHLKELWRGQWHGVPDVVMGMEQAIGGLLEKRAEVRAEWEAVGVEFRKIQGDSK